mmetsp:Transcript_9169/g.17128  ORF Transcript_9169/g.17128 Transcript_9169/m.17128 type:complete len:203 (+) Transcript_9169:550-1158(+)
MAEAWDHLTGGQRVLCKLCHDFHGWLLISQGLFRILKPLQAFLIGKAMQRPREPIDASRECQIGIRESACHQMCSMCRDIATLMIGMDHEVQTHHVLEALGIVDTQHLSIVGCPVQGVVTGDVVAIEEHVPENSRRQYRNLGNHVQAVLQSVHPVVFLLHAVPVLPIEVTVRLQSKKPHGQLRHWMDILSKAVDCFDHILWK